MQEPDAVITGVAISLPVSFDDAVTTNVSPVGRVRRLSVKVTMGATAAFMVVTNFKCGAHRQLALPAWLSIPSH